MQILNTAWYELAPDEVLSRLETRAEGLDDATALKRLDQFGPNAIEFEKTPAWLRFLRQRTGRGDS